jgi:predicted nucleic acid-binding protein
MVALEWGDLTAPQPGTIDELVAATAMLHGMTVVTRNVKDVEHTRVSHLNTFEPMH